LAQVCVVTGENESELVRVRFELAMADIPV